MSAGPTRRWPPPMGDAVLAVAFALLGASLAIGVLDSDERVAAVVVTVVHSAALAWRRSAPMGALAAMGMTAAAVTAAGWPPVVLGPAILPAVHGLGSARDRDRALPALGATLLVMAAVVTAGDGDATTVVGDAVAITVAWWLGDRQRRMREDAAHAVVEAAARAEQAVVDERRRIARELHDVVAHALSVIAVQAGTGRVVLDRDPAAARDALAHIEGESRAALGEMRRLLHVLRDEDDVADGPLEPSPQLDDLEALVAANVRSGLPVEVRIEGERRPLPPGPELAAYRIIQEALTNVRRHARATRAQVRVSWHGDAIDVEVVDDGHGSGVAGNGAGHGLVGMRERAALYGGTVEAGDRRDGRGFRVAAHIPSGSAT